VEALIEELNTPEPEPTQPTTAPPTQQPPFTPEPEPTEPTTPPPPPEEAGTAPKIDEYDREQAYSLIDPQSVEVTVYLGTGSLAATGIAGVALKNGEPLSLNSHYTFSGTTLTILNAWLAGKLIYDGDKGELVVTFNDTANTKDDITIEATTLAPFKIGADEYATLAAAVASATSMSTIIMQSNYSITTEDPIIIAANTTLDIGEYRLRIGSGSSVTNNGTISSLGGFFYGDGNFVAGEHSSLVGLELIIYYLSHNEGPNYEAHERGSPTKALISGAFGGNVGVVRAETNLAYGTPGADEVYLVIPDSVTKFNVRDISRSGAAPEAYGFRYVFDRLSSSEDWDITAHVYNTEQFMLVLKKHDGRDDNYNHYTPPYHLPQGLMCDYFIRTIVVEGDIGAPDPVLPIYTDIFEDGYLLLKGNATASAGRDLVIRGAEACNRLNFGVLIGDEAKVNIEHITIAVDSPTAYATPTSIQNYRAAVFVVGTGAVVELQGVTITLTDTDAAFNTGVSSYGLYISDAVERVSISACIITNEATAPSGTYAVWTSKAGGTEIAGSYLKAHTPLAIGEEAFEDGITIADVEFDRTGTSSRDILILGATSAFKSGQENAFLSVQVNDDFDLDVYFTKALQDLLDGVEDEGVQVRLFITSLGAGGENSNGFLIRFNGADWVKIVIA
jgi:hypothetical protein